MTVNPKALGCDWLFHRNFDLVVDLYANSIATFESEEDERAVCEWYRERVRRGRPSLTEWSELTDPFEAAGWADWSPVRSVKLATPGRKVAAKEATDAGVERSKLGAGRKLLVVKPAESTAEPTRQRRIRRPYSLKVEDIPTILEELRSWQPPGRAC